MTEVLIVTGPCGVGKTSVAFECLELLEEDGVPAAMIDAELVYFHPHRPEDPRKTQVAEAALTRLWPLYRDEGIEHLVLARVVEAPADVDLVRRAVPGATVRVVWLDASVATVEGRLRSREKGSALSWYLAKAASIRSSDARVLADFSLSAERPVGETARDVLSHIGWLRPSH